MLYQWSWNLTTLCKLHHWPSACVTGSRDFLQPMIPCVVRRNNIYEHVTPGRPLVSRRRETNFNTFCIPISTCTEVLYSPNFVIISKLLRGL
jgi:hypothetical protein